MARDLQGVRNTLRSWERVRTPHFPGCSENPRHVSLAGGCVDEEAPGERVQWLAGLGPPGPPLSGSWQACCGRGTPKPPEGTGRATLDDGGGPDPQDGLGGGSLTTSQPRLPHV